MAEPRSTTAGGFTIIEMMAAIAILAFGLTALLGVLMVGVGTRRSAEQEQRAVVLAGQALERAEQHIHQHSRQAREDGKIPDLRVDTVPGCPGIGYKLSFKVAEPERDLVLVDLEVSWLESGEATTLSFHHVLPMQEIFTERIARLRAKP